MNTLGTEHTANSEIDAQGISRAFKIGGAGIAGASAGALMGTAIAGLSGGVIGAVIVAGANMLLNSHNERKIIHSE